MTVQINSSTNLARKQVRNLCSRLVMARARANQQFLYRITTRPPPSMHAPPPPRPPCTTSATITSSLLCLQCAASNTHTSPLHCLRRHHNHACHTTTTTVTTAFTPLLVCLSTELLIHVSLFALPSVHADSTLLPPHTSFSNVGVHQIILLHDHSPPRFAPLRHDQHAACYHDNHCYFSEHFYCMQITTAV